MLVMLGLALGFSLVQDIIAIEYVVLTMNRTNVNIFSELSPHGATRTSSCCSSTSSSSWR